MTKGLEALEKSFWKLTHKGNISNYNIIEKELKALEIIINKGVNVGYFMHRVKDHNLTYEEYLYEVKNCLDAPISQELLTQEEYYLLRRCCYE